VRAIAERLRQRAPAVEFNIEGDPRPELLNLVAEVRPSQCTLVPVSPGEITSQAGWQPASGAQSTDALPDVVRDLKARGIRVSLFVDAEMAAIRWAASMSADRVELYTEPFARAFAKGPASARESFARFEAAARLAASLGLGVNAGHDLDLDNLVLFRNLPSLAEVSIGHAIVSRALFVGLSTVVREYLDVLQQRLLS
jgi:pyridoxine 5-phosphate synthase